MYNYVIPQQAYELRNEVWNNTMKSKLKSIPLFLRQFNNFNSVIQ